MRLIGMLDSPFVRRCAVSLQLPGLRFEHEPWIARVGAQLGESAMGAAAR